ncbi:MAG TPA: dodecin family protein [Gammaproteobacteria bacterium]|nr:dodecin family protein [Gammaproteobacteria bacterium]
MTALKVIEVLTQSDKSWEDAAQEAVSQVSKTMRDVRSVYIHDMEATVEDGKIKTYRVNARVTFALEKS